MRQTGAVQDPGRPNPRWARGSSAEVGGGFAAFALETAAAEFAQQSPEPDTAELYNDILVEA